MNTSPSQRELLLRARRGDEGAARALWQAMAPRMLAYAAMLAGSADAQDIVQGVFMRALRARRRDLARIDDGAAYLLGATRNEAMNTLRARNRRHAHESAAPPAPAISAPADDALLKALSALPEPQREAVWLRHGAGLTFDQLALALDLPRSTAASRYQAGVSALRAALREKEPTHA
ncbi:MAG: RNA polymerase sigma factor [Phycisphaerales bacterium JB039]